VSHQYQAQQQLMVLLYKAKVFMMGFLCQLVLLVGVGVEEATLLVGMVVEEAALLIMIML
jgi:hypothetical protein